MPRLSGARMPVGALVTALVMLLAVLPSASGRTTIPAAFAALPAPKDPVQERQPRPCKGKVVWGTEDADSRSDFDAYGDPVADTIICALGGNDVIIVGGTKTVVWAGSGDDVIRAKTPRGNPVTKQLIIGESGADRLADRDAGDRFCQETFPCRAGRASRSEQYGPRRVSSHDRYPGLQPVVRCISNQGYWQVYFDPPPVMRAFDGTNEVDWQYVAWSPVLARYDATAGMWKVDFQHEWLWDITYEGRDFGSGNTWRRFDNNAIPDLDPRTAGQPWRLWFNIRSAGTYRVAIIYYHYPAGALLPARRVYAWVDRHEGQYGRTNGSFQFCTFG